MSPDKGTYAAEFVPFTFDACVGFDVCHEVLHVEGEYDVRREIVVADAEHRNLIC